MNEIVEVQNADQFNELSVAGHIAQRDRLVEIMHKVMKKDVHYGTIPGTNKPSLYKPGAERLLMTFGLSAGKEDEWPIQDLSSDTERRFRVMVPIYHRSSGTYLGFGVGECSSAEDKYAWRGVVCDEEFDEFDPDDRREKWKYGKGGKPYKVKQVRMNPADIANTVLKMAKKRALIDGSLTTTGASEVFAQDVEDMPREHLGKPSDDTDQPRHQGRPSPQSGPIVPKTSFFKEWGGKPWSEVPRDQLDWYAEAIHQNIEDPAKSRFKAQNQATLEHIIAAIDANNKLNAELDAQAAEE